MVKNNRIFIIGAVITLLGIGLMIVSKLKIPFFLGRLPGDIIIRKENFTFYLPITTCLLISAVISIIYFLLKR